MKIEMMRDKTLGEEGEGERERERERDCLYKYLRLKHTIPNDQSTCVVTISRWPVMHSVSTRSIDNVFQHT